MPDGSTETRTYQWRETITFQSCQHGEPLRDVKPSQLLSIDQVFVMYDPNNRLIRFAMTNKIRDVNGENKEIFFFFLISLFWFELISFLQSNMFSDVFTKVMLLLLLFLCSAYSVVINLSLTF